MREKYIREKFLFSLSPHFSFSFPFLVPLKQRIIITFEPLCSRVLWRAMSSLFAQLYILLTGSYGCPTLPSRSELTFSYREITTNLQSATSLKTNSDIKFVPHVQNSTPHSLLSLSKIPTMEKPWILLGQLLFLFHLKRWEPNTGWCGWCGWCASNRQSPTMEINALDRLLGSFSVGFYLQKPSSVSVFLWLTMISTVEKPQAINL
jgi:hypothetical protein